MKTLVLGRDGWPVEQIEGRPIINWLRRVIHGNKRVCACCWEKSNAEGGFGA